MLLLAGNRLAWLIVTQGSFFVGTLSKPLAADDGHLLGVSHVVKAVKGHLEYEGAAVAQLRVRNGRLTSLITEAGMTHGGLAQALARLAAENGADDLA